MGVLDKAHCAEHERFRLSCHNCVDERMVQMEAEDFPGLRHWQHRVGSEELLQGWRAGMYPLLGSTAAPTYTLTSPSYSREHMSESYSLRGQTQDWLLDRAREIAAAEVS